MANEYEYESRYYGEEIDAILDLAKSSLATPIGEQVETKVLEKTGDLNNLTTIDKTNLVAAINELASKSIIKKTIETEAEFDGITESGIYFIEYSGSGRQELLFVSDWMGAAIAQLHLSCDEIYFRTGDGTGFGEWKTLATTDELGDLSALTTNQTNLVAAINSLVPKAIREIDISDEAGYDSITEGGIYHVNPGNPENSAAATLNVAANVTYDDTGMATASVVQTRIINDKIECRCSKEASEIASGGIPTFTYRIVVSEWGDWVELSNQSQTGVLSDLDTKTKDTLVAAINELHGESPKLGLVSNSNYDRYTAAGYYNVDNAEDGIIYKEKLIVSSYIADEGTIQVAYAEQVLVRRSGVYYRSGYETSDGTLSWGEWIRLDVPVVDNLMSKSTSSALSANQGKVLAGMIGTLSDLTTSNQENLVAAINEVNATTSNLDSITESIDSTYEEKTSKLENDYLVAVANLEEKYDQAIEDLSNKFEDGSPKGVFSSVEELSGKDAGTYLNATDGWIYYWDGSSLSEGICLYQAAAIESITDEEIEEILR